MTRRKSLIAQMYAARQKAKLQQQKLEEQATRAWPAEERRVAAQLEKEAAQQRREAELAAQARLRQEQQAERTRQQEAAKAERLGAQEQREREGQAAAEAREQQRREAGDRREQQASEADRRRRTVERRSAEAEVKTEAVQATIAAFERLLTDRNRHPAAQHRRARSAAARPPPPAPGPRPAAAPRPLSARTARRRSWRRSSGHWRPRCIRRAWMGRARHSTSPSPASCGSSMSCPARTSSPR